MSRAFVKEDIEIPERVTRRRSASGLPPGAANLITSQGAQQLQTRLAELVQGGRDAESVARLRHLLESATIVEPVTRPGAIFFGSTVTLRNAAGQEARHRITGVDEVDLDPDNVSWVSPLGKTLLNSELGQSLRLTPDDKTLWMVVQVD